MTEKEIIRVCISDDGQLDVTVAAFCPEDKANRLANDVAKAIMKLIGESILAESRALNTVRPTLH